MKRYCFIEGKRPCTLKCMAAYEDKNNVECGVIWSLRQLGWSSLKKGMQVYKELKKKK